MVFRRLYWVLEEVRPDGSSFLNGVFTSVPDLARTGFRRLDASDTRFRLNLIKLDADKGPFGTWLGADSERMMADLQPFVDTGEFTDEECRNLRDVFASHCVA